MYKNNYEVMMLRKYDSILYFVITFSITVTPMLMWCLLGIT